MQTYHRPANERGTADFGWLNANYTFSFANYHDKNHMGFASLRVINEDYIDPGKGFDMHPHRDMEILTYVIEGQVQHQDNQGNKMTISAGEFQLMSAGSGIVHSEYNPSPSDTLHLYQIWLRPHSRGLQPAYHHLTQAQIDTLPQTSPGLTPIVISNPNPTDKHTVGPTTNQMQINLDATISHIHLNPDSPLTLPLKPDRHYWLQLITGSVTVNDTTLNTSDGLGLTQADSLQLHATSPESSLLFFDMP